MFVRSKWKNVVVSCHVDSFGVIIVHTLIDSFVISVIYVLHWFLRVRLLFFLILIYLYYVFCFQLCVHHVLNSINTYSCLLWVFPTFCCCIPTWGSLWHFTRGLAGKVLENVQSNWIEHLRSHMQPLRKIEIESSFTFTQSWRVVLSATANFNLMLPRINLSHWIPALVVPI